MRLVILLAVFLMSFQCLALDNYPVVLLELIENDNRHGYATGFFLSYSNETILVTNSHVCDDAKFITVSEPTMLSAFVRRQADTMDLCVLDFFGVAPTNPLVLGGPGYPKESVTIVGYPSGVRTVSTGVIDKLSITKINGSKTACTPDNNCYKDKDNKEYSVYIGFPVHDKTIKEGSSGSPVLDKDGRVIGIVNGCPVDPKDDEGFAIPSFFLKVLLDEANGK